MITYSAVPNAGTPYTGQTYAVYPDRLADSRQDAEADEAHSAGPARSSTRWARSTRSIPTARSRRRSRSRPTFRVTARRQGLQRAGDLDRAPHVQDRLPDLQRVLWQLPRADRADRTRHARAAHLHRVEVQRLGQGPQHRRYRRQDGRLPCSPRRRQALPGLPHAQEQA